MTTAAAAAATLAGVPPGALPGGRCAAHVSRLHFDRRFFFSRRGGVINVHARFRGGRDRGETGETDGVNNESDVYKFTLCSNIPKMTMTVHVLSYNPQTEQTRGNGILSMTVLYAYKVVRLCLILMGLSIATEIRFCFRAGDWFLARKS